MIKRVKVAVIGIHRPVLDGLRVGDIDFVAAFATSPEKIGRDLTEAIFLPRNNFPIITSELPLTGITARPGRTGR